MTRFFSALLLLVVAAAAQDLAPVVAVDHGPNSAAARVRPYVVLLSLDGFRWDFAAKYHARNLLALAARGASAPQGMIPAFPSLTFPNHYTLATGLYPEHHGIVGNRFYDPQRGQEYDFRNPATVTDGSWYGGVPLWVLAERQGMRSACFFWPGSEAEIDGVRPSYYLKFDDRFPDRRRIRQVIAWLKLPPAVRPHLITLYYSNVDHAGHRFGPDSAHTAAAVRHVDRLVGELSRGLDALHLPINLIVLSDHGMAALRGDWISLDRFASLAEFRTSGELLYAPDEAQAARAERQLRGASDTFRVYRRAGVPAGLHFSSNPRIGDPVIVATGPYPIRFFGDAAARPGIQGQHGFDPAQVPEMRAIFYAAGPGIRRGIRLAPFENVDVYPLVARLLGLRIGEIDGSIAPLQKALASHPRKPAGAGR